MKNLKEWSTFRKNNIEINLRKWLNRVGSQYLKWLSKKQNCNDCCYVVFN